MHLVKLPRSDGTFAFVNPQLIRAVVVNDRQTSMVQFDADHVIMIREEAEKVAEQIAATAALNGEPAGRS